MSTTSIAQSIEAVSQQFTLYVSFIILFAGLFGHLCNIFVLTRLKIFRGNPSVFYLIVESIVAFLQLLIAFSSRIAMKGFHNDLTQTSLLWCKLRIFLSNLLGLELFSIICFAATDQFLSTSYQPHLRRMSTIKTARKLVIISIFLWSLYNLPIIILSTIQPGTGCAIDNQIYTNFTIYFYDLILDSILPITVSTVFSTLAHRNVRRIVRRGVTRRRRRLDQQLTAMILVRIAFFVAVTMPYVLYRIYELSTPIKTDDLIPKATVQLVGAVTLTVWYLNFAGSFFLFLKSSSRYRRQVKYAFVNKLWRKSIRRNQVSAEPRNSLDKNELECVQ